MRCAGAGARGLLADAPSPAASTKGGAPAGDAAAIFPTNHPSAFPLSHCARGRSSHTSLPLRFSRAPSEAATTSSTAASTCLRRSAFGECRLRKCTEMHDALSSSVTPAGAPACHARNAACAIFREGSSSSATTFFPNLLDNTKPCDEATDTW